jgi:hypothetical protein
VELVGSNGTSRGRHRLADPVGRPALLPRSLNVVSVTVGAVLVLAAQDSPGTPEPRPHWDTPPSALQPVVLAPEPRPAPATVTGKSIAGAHLSATASVHAD